MQKKQNILENENINLFEKITRLKEFIINEINLLKFFDKKGNINDCIAVYYSSNNDNSYIEHESQLFNSYIIDDLELVEKWLSIKRGSKVVVKNPQKGDKEKLVELAARNARIVLEQDIDKLRSEERKTRGAIAEIDGLLGLDYTKRIEAFDISNTNGFDSVGSMVVYEDGKPKRSDYRKFKIKTVTGPDDYASMREVLTRRFRHGLEEIEELKETSNGKEYSSFTRFPDLIMMDGGRGQVNIALSVLEEFGINIPVCGMVKDDHHRTRGLYFENQEIPIDTHSEGFRLITRVQDEAHRFAITFHKDLRSKKQVHSILDDIEGIGEARRNALLREFNSIEDIKNASVTRLKNVDSMNERAAQKVYDFFH